MIEVERKFVPDDVTIARLLELGKDIQTRSMVDEYYDTETLSLTMSDRWLRRRCVDGRETDLELKLPESPSRGGSDVYQELLGSEAISSALSMDIQGDTQEALHLAQLYVFARIETKRTSFQVEHRGTSLRVDLDEMDFGYRIGEVEILVKTREEIGPAEAIILDFAKEQQLRIQHAPSKVLEYIRRMRPHHFNCSFPNSASPKTNEKPIT